MRRPSPSPLAFIRSLAFAFMAAPLALVQGQTRANDPAAVAPSTSSSKAPGKVLQLEDYARWNRITSPALSPDGKWMTFTYSPNEGGQTILHVKALDGTKD